MKTRWNNALIIFLTIVLIVLCLAGLGFCYGYAIGKLSPVNFGMALALLIGFSGFIISRVPVEK